MGEGFPLCEGVGRVLVEASVGGTFCAHTLEVDDCAREFLAEVVKSKVVTCHGNGNGTMTCN